MKFREMILPLCAMMCAGSALPGTLGAQTDDGTQAPKILMTVREVMKPGKDGASHEKTEAAYLHAIAAGKSKMHYVAMTSLSGQPRALFLSGYPSFDAIEQERKSMGPALQASLDQANQADGELLSETATAVWVRRDDMSHNAHGMQAGTRYFEVRQLSVKPGQDAEFERLVKLVNEGYKKADPEGQWVAYEMLYGNTPAMPGPVYLILTPMKSLSEVDTGMATDQRFMEAMGEDGMKKMAELEADCLLGNLVNVFAISPKMSAPPEWMAKAEPDYWKPKGTGAALASARRPANPVVAADRKPAGQ